MELTIKAKMSAGESLEARFEKIDAMLKDPKSEVNTDCLLVSLQLGSWFSSRSGSDYSLEQNNTGGAHHPGVKPQFVVDIGDR